MPGRPGYKRKRDAFEKGDGGNRTRISRKGQTNHCKICKETGHNQRSCHKREGSAQNVRIPKVGKKKGSAQTKGGKKKGYAPQTPSTNENAQPTSCEGWAQTPSTLVEGDADEIPIIGSAPAKERKNASKGHASSSAAIETVQEPVEEVQEQPIMEEEVQDPPVFIKRESERIKQLKFHMPPSPGPGLTPDDAILLKLQTVWLNMASHLWGYFVHLPYDLICKHFRIFGNLLLIWFDLICSITATNFVWQATCDAVL